MDTEERQAQLAIHRAEQADAIAKQKEGKKQCPECKSWDVYQAMLKDGGMGDYCPNCRKSFKAIESFSVAKKKPISDVTVICLAPFLFILGLLIIVFIYHFIAAILK